MSLPAPSSTIAGYTHAFDDEEAAVEDTPRDLIAAFPNNTKFTHVHITIITISLLYRGTSPEHRRRASCPAHHVANLDRLLAKGSTEAVDLIQDCSTTYRKYSFATMSRSWHNQTAYSLLDYNVDEAL
jgi:hypothetical protein